VVISADVDSMTSLVGPAVLVVLAAALVAAGLAIAARRARRRTEQGEDLRTMLDVAHRGSRGERPLEAICAAACQLTGAATAVLWRADDSGALRAAAAAGADGRDWAARPAPPLGGRPAGEGQRGHGLPRQIAPPAASDVAVQCLRSAARVVAAGARSPAWRTTLAEPALLDQRCVGVLTVGWRRGGRRPSRREGALLTLLALEMAMVVRREEQVVSLRTQAHTDELTGALNRRALGIVMRREIDRASRVGTRLSVALLDLDGFKAYNDRDGHDAGDVLLRRAVAAWSEGLRETDLLARLGGDEFAVVLPECDRDAAVQVIDALRRRTPSGVGASAGVAEWNRRESPRELLRRADAALYEGKLAGRQRTVAARELHGSPALGAVPADAAV